MLDSLSLSLSTRRVIRRENQQGQGSPPDADIVTGHHEDPSRVQGKWEVVNWAIAAILTFSSLAKIVDGYDPRFVLGEQLYYASAIAEAALSAALVAGWWYRSALAAVVILAAGGVVTALLMPDRPCGCFGSWLHDSSHHLLLSGLLGFAACACLVMRCRRQGRIASRDRIQGAVAKNLSAAMVLVATAVALLFGWTSADVHLARSDAINLEQAAHARSKIVVVPEVAGETSSVDRVPVEAGHLRVRVMEGGSLKAISGSRVALHPGSSRYPVPPIAQAVTDSDGAAVVAWPAAGVPSESVVLVTAAGFASKSVKLTCEIVKAGWMDVVLSLGSQLTIAVRDYRGLPIANARVAVSRVAFARVPGNLLSGECGSGGAAVYYVQADEFGNARFANLQDGEYHVQVNHPGHMVIETSFPRTVVLSGVCAGSVVLAPLVGAAFKVVGDEVVSYSASPSGPSRFRPPMFGDTINQVRREFAATLLDADCVFLSTPEESGDSRIEVEFLFVKNGAKRMIVDLFPSQLVTTRALDPRVLDSAGPDVAIERVEFRLMFGSRRAQPHGLLSLIGSPSPGGAPVVNKRELVKNMAKSMINLHSNEAVWVPRGGYKVISSDPLMQRLLRSVKNLDVTPSVGRVDIPLSEGYVIRRVSVDIDGGNGVGSGRIVLYESENDSNSVHSIFMEDPLAYVVLPIGRFYADVQIGGLELSERVVFDVKDEDDPVELKLKSK